MSSSNLMRIFYCSQPVSMRRSFDGLAALVAEYIHQNPKSGYLFVFFGRSGKMMKVLRWEGDVFSPSPLKLKSRFRYEKIYFITTF